MKTKRNPVKRLLILAACLSVFGCKEPVPPLDTTCTTDADCELTTKDITGDACCSACDSVAVSKTWLSQADAACKSQTEGKDYFDRCPRLSCTEPPETTAVCASGTCMTKTTTPK